MDTVNTLKNKNVIKIRTNEEGYDALQDEE